MRYLDRDLPPAVYRQVRDLAFIQDLEDLKEKLATASAWGATLLQELHSV
jgi:glutamine synthetase adenylyltransferase